MELLGATANAAEADVVGAYRLVLRREPETETAVAANVGRPIVDLVRTFFDSQEFRVAVRDPVESSRFCPAALEAPGQAAVAWALKRLPITPMGRKRFAAASNWLTLYHALLTDDAFTKWLNETPSWLEERRVGPDGFQGEVWGSDGKVVRGWLIPLGAKKSPMAVELWRGDQLVGRGLANVFDRGLEQRFPGHGGSSFRVAIPLGRQDASFLVEVREATTGLAFGEVEVQQAFADRGSVGEVDARLQALEAELAALRGTLPRMSHQLATPLPHYSEHYKRWLSDPYGEQLYSDTEAAVLIDAIGVPSEQVERAAQAALQQTHARLSLHLVVTDAELPLYVDLARRLGAAAGAPVTAATAETLAFPTTASLVALLSARCLLHPDMIAAGAVYLAEHPDFHCVYFDEDALAREDVEGALIRHVSPRFKPSFDSDLLLQTPYVGTAVMLQADAWRRVAPTLAFGGSAASQAALAVDAEGLAIGHSPVVMAAWQTGSDAAVDGQDWSDRVQAHLHRTASGAFLVEPQDDLGAPTEGRSRVVWPLPERATATVIIPTRDRLDLLRPCLESLFEHERANQAVMELVIVDHESAEAETITYLAELTGRPRVRILPYAGTFNWALMNNIAAEQATGDVLVFLNNDTLVISHGWLDELTSQAMRPEVGAVGCRLVYPDGTLQHGGFVAAEQRNIFLGHEGLGTPGGDGGYLGRHAVVRQTTAVTGACMAVAASRFAEMGGFEAAAFPVDGNDVDFCFRVRDRGLRVLYTPYATLNHLESKTRAAGEQQHAAFQAANDRLWNRWGGRFGNDPYYNINFDRLAEPFARLRPPPRLS